MHKPLSPVMQPLSNAPRRSAAGLRHAALQVVRALDKALPLSPPIDDVFTAITYFRAHGRLPRRLSHPKATYNDFIIARMSANDWSDEERRLIDKAEVKDFVAGTCPGAKTPKTVDIIEIDDIDDVAALERRLAPYWGRPVVFKPTHSSGSVVFARQGRDLKALSQLYDIARLDFYRISRESQYKGLARRIIVEEELNPGGDVPWDYKFFCSHGLVLFIQVDTGRFEDHRRAVFNENFEMMDIRLKFDLPQDRVEAPCNFEAMKDIASALSASFPFVRVDLYTIGGEVFVGEMTFAPEGGTGSLSDERFGIDVLGKIRAAQSRAGKAAVTDKMAANLHPACHGPGGQTARAPRAASPVVAKNSKSSL